VVAGDTVTEFTLCDLATGRRFTVPVGSTSGGTAPPNIDGDWTLELRNTYDLMTPLPAGELDPRICPTADLEGAVLVIRGTRASIDGGSGLGTLVGTVEGAPKDSPAWLGAIQQSLNGAVITLHPDGESAPEYKFAVATTSDLLSGGVSMTSAQDPGARVSNCDAGVVATRGGSAPAPTSTTSTSTTSTTSAAAAGAALEGVDWGNRTYRLGEDCQGPDITLRNGSFEDAAGLFGVRLVDVLYGDLTGDGHTEAVLKFECYAIGGNAYPATPVIVFTSNASGPVQLGQVFEGNDATIVGDAVQTTESIWGPNDPRCCPSSTVTHTWRYSNGSWVSSP
jgi:hypothetical protein